MAKWIDYNIENEETFEQDLLTEEELEDLERLADLWTNK